MFHYYMKLLMAKWHIVNNLYEQFIIGEDAINHLNLTLYGWSILLSIKYAFPAGENGLQTN